MHPTKGKLSSYYPNADKNQLVYRKNDYYTYSTIEEAQEHLKYIQDTAKQKCHASKLFLHVTN